MYKTRKLLLFLAVISISPLSSAATNIDIMIVFSDDSGLSTSEKTALAGRYQMVLSNVYGGATVATQLDGDQTVTVWPLLFPEMSYTASDKSDTQALQWMKDQNAKELPLPSPLRVARDALGNPGADLILMVVPETTSNTCGAVGPGEVPLVPGTNRSELDAFAVVHLESVDPDCAEDIVVPHEVGHMLYSEHDTDTNGDDLLPAFYNHATQASDSTLKSLMWDGINSTVTSLLSGFLPNMTTSWADNVEFMSTTTFEIVAAYRSPPPPPAA